MPRWLNILMQLSALGANGYSLMSGVLPAKYMVPVTIAIQSFVSVVGIIAHNFNPDGTPVSVPYEKR